MAAHTKDLPKSGGDDGDDGPPEVVGVACEEPRGVRAQEESRPQSAVEAWPDTVSGTFHQRRPDCVLK